MTREKEILFRGITTLAGLRNILLHRRIAKRGGRGNVIIGSLETKTKKEERIHGDSYYVEKLRKKQNKRMMS